MTGRRTWASDDEREAWQTDNIEGHETRIDAIEAAPSAPSPGSGGDISQIDSGDATAAGASGRYADAAHQHALPAPGTPAASAVGDAASVGTGTKVALDTHRHAREAFASPAASAVGDTQAAGTATTVPHSDHVHAREAFAAPGASAPGDTAAAGTATTVPRSDHRHAREAFGAADDITSVDAGDSAVAGSTGKVADAGHQHATTLTGSGGAPTTAQYLVTAADAGLSAERVVDLGAFSLLTPRPLANAEDDLFDAASLDAKWLAYTGANAVTDLTALLGWCKITTAGYKLQAVPAGDWIIETEVIIPSRTTAGFQDVGLILTNGTTATSATDARFGIGMNNSLTDFRLVFEKFVNNAFSALYGTAWTGRGPLDRLFLRIVKSGTTYGVEWSTTARSWQRWNSTSSLGFTPTHFGFGTTEAGSFHNQFLRY